MTIKQTTLTLLAFAGLHVNAQDVTITNGTQFTMVNKNEEILTILNMDRNDFSFLTKKGIKTYRVMSLDEKLAMDKSTELDLPEVNGKEVKYIDAGQLGEKTYFYSQYFEKKKDVMNLYASDLEVSKGKFNEHYEAMSIQDDKFNFLQRPFKVVRSIDSTKVLFISTYPTKGKDKARIAVKVTDNEMKEIWKKDIIFNQLDKNFTVLDYLLDKNGNIHITASVRMDNDEKKEKGAKGRYYVAIYSYFHETGELKEYEVGFKNEIILDAKIQLNEKDELIGTGFYGEKKLFDAGMKGFFYLRIDTKTKEIVASNLSPFDKKFLGELMNERRAEKGKGLFNYVIRNTFANPDGTMTVVSEYYTYTEYYDQNGNLSTIIWQYGNVLVFNVGSDGAMNAYSILKKNQTAVWKNSILNQAMAAAGVSLYPGAVEVPYYGIGTMLKDGTLYLLYNENPKNAERLKTGKKPRSVRSKSSETMLVTVTKDGDMKSNMLFKSKDKSQGYTMPLMPRYHFRFSNDAMLVIGRKGKNARVTEVKVM